MNSNFTPARERFEDYLAKKLGKQQARNIVYSSQRNVQENKSPFMFTPKKQLSSQQSLNSSSLTFSNYGNSISTVSCKPLPKTISIGKRLRKIKNIEENTCPICLSQVSQKSQLECKHCYCRECLSEWLKNSDRCPYCRQKSQYYIYNNERIKIQEKVFVPQDIFDQNQQQLDYECYKCEQTNQGDTVIICDQCLVHACHPSCDQYLRGKIPRQNQQWFCHFCR